MVPQKSRWSRVEIILMHIRNASQFSTKRIVWHQVLILKKLVTFRNIIGIIMSVIGQTLMIFFSGVGKCFLLFRHYVCTNDNDKERGVQK